MPTQERLRELLDYDPETGIFTRRVKTGPRVRIGDVAGGVDSYGYIQIRVDSKLYLAHRLAWLYVHGVWPAKEIDHINRIRCDNRIINLRECTRAENLQNLAPRKKAHGSSMGATWRSDTGKWQATIAVGGKNIFLGYYATESEAAAVYAEAKAKYHTFHPFVTAKSA